MTSSGWLRAAAGLTLFNAVGHTFGAVLAGPSHGPGEVALRDAMRGYRVVLMGVERSYWDFYIGSGWAITVFALMLTAVMWLLVPVAGRAAREARALIVVLAAGFAALTVVSILYFVTAPIVNLALITTCLVAAALKTTPPGGR